MSFSKKDVCIEQFSKRLSYKSTCVPIIFVIVLMEVGTLVHLISAVDLC